MFANISKSLRISDLPNHNHKGEVFSCVFFFSAKAHAWFSIPCVCVSVWFYFLFLSVFGAGTPVASFSVAKRELAFRLLFNKPADGACWLWTSKDTHWESQKEEKDEKERGEKKAYA